MSGTSLIATGTFRSLYTGYRFNSSHVRSLRTTTHAVRHAKTLSLSKGLNVLNHAPTIFVFLALVAVFILLLCPAFGLCRVRAATSLVRAGAKYAPAAFFAAKV